jgi:glucosylceramidase
MDYSLPLRSVRLGGLAILLLGGVTPARPAASLHWISSTQTTPWKETVVASSDDPANQSPEADVLKFNPQVVYQVIDGFGGCFNDLGWQALLALPPASREAALKALFDPDGANFTLCRAPIGANDFSLKAYSLDDVAGDESMKYFSIERDRQDLIPYIKAAMRYQPMLGVWGVPWSPPGWMKTSGHYKGGDMKQDASTLAAYARYFSRYVQAYRAEGINIYAVMPQNEPKYSNGIYPQCHWTGAELNGFIRDYLAPRLREDRVPVEIWLGTIVNDRLADYVDPVLSDPVTNREVTGVGYQYAGQNAMAETHRKYPDKKLAQTETECFNGKNTWEEGMDTFGKIVRDTDNFAGSYFYWNMILNESGRSTWDWSQDSLLTVDRHKDTVIYNPSFYAMKHFSGTVSPGAKRIEASGGPLPKAVAFVNPNGTTALIFANETDQPVSMKVSNGHVRASLLVPAKSMNTVIFDQDSIR